MMTARAWPRLGEANTRGTTMAARREGWASERGLSLVEVTIMLVILMILAGTLVPVMSDSVNSARMVRARNDLSQLAMALTNFQRDVGPIVFDGSRLTMIQTTKTAVAPVALLTSDAPRPDAADRVPVESVTNLLVNPALTLDATALTPWVDTAAVDLVDYHLRVNGRGYAEATGGPGTGWNGPYLAKEAKGDPWGRAYLINTAFLRGLPAKVSRCSRCAVFVISAGANGIIETPFEQPISNANIFGDDLAVRIQ